MSWTLNVNDKGELSVNLNGDKNISITPREVALLALGLLLHDIAKPYALGGGKHALLGYIYLEDTSRFRKLLEKLSSELDIDKQLLSNLSDDELAKVREVVLLHHMEIDKDWLKSIHIKKIENINSKLAVLFSHPFDYIASSVYGFVSEELINRLSESQSGKFIQVNPFSRIPIGELIISKPIPDPLTAMTQDSVEKVVERYLRDAREKTFEPACDIPLYDHGVFAASLSLMLCHCAGIDGIRDNVIDERDLEKIFKNYISNVKLAWLIVDITRLWSLVERSLKPDDLAGFAYFVDACQKSFTKVISETAVEKLYGCSGDPLLREIAEKVLVPLTRRGSVIISLLPVSIAEDIRQAFEEGKLLQKVREEVLKELLKKSGGEKLKADGIEVDLERILRYSTVISLAIADFHELQEREVQEDKVYVRVARGLQNKLVEALRGLGVLQVLEKDPEPPKEPCWYCGVNEAVESIDTYYYGGEDIPIKACRACQHVRMLGKQLVQASKTYAEISEEENIGLIALIPGVKVFYSGWDLDAKITSEIERPLKDIKKQEKIKKIERLPRYIKKQLDEAINKLHNNKNAMRQSLEKIPSILEVLKEAPKASSVHDDLCKVIGPLKSKIENIKDKMRKFEVIFRILDNYSYNLAERFTRILSNTYWVMEYRSGSSRGNAEIPEYSRLLMFYYDLLLVEIFLEKFFNSLKIVLDSTEPLITTLFTIIDIEKEESKKESLVSLFIAHPARLMARERFWSGTIEKISRELKKALVIPERGNYLFIVVPGEKVWEALSKILTVLKEEGFLKELSVFGPFAWKVLDVEGPVIALSVFIANGKYPLYRLLRTAFEVTRRPFEHWEDKYPVRCFLADIRTGFDPAPGAYTLVPLWLFAYLFDAVEGAGREELLLAHRLLLAGGYDKAQEAIAAAVRRSSERGLRGKLMEALEIERMRLDPSIYYVLASLINLKRYCQTR
jgi:hypothetical protein